MNEHGQESPSNRPPVNWEHIPRDDAERLRALAHDGGIANSESSPDDYDDGTARSSWERAKLPLLLFVATCLSTFYVAGAESARSAGEKAGIFGNAFVTGGLTYAVPVMVILLCHEFGHFIQALRYGVPASLPYFIPMPFSPLGTMGAVIGMSGRIPNRKALFDIGISGPLAGLVPAFIATWLGIKWSTPQIIDPRLHDGPVFGAPLLFRWISEYHHGPIPGLDMHPLAMAGWAGIFVTALNLIPIGQLDGGHILYSMLRRLSYPITTMLLYGALAAMILTHNYGWSLMVMLLLLSGPNHPPTHNDAEPLGWGRTVLGWLTLSFIVIGFTPVPIVAMR